jgi:hypothetical protein
MLEGTIRVGNVVGYVGNPTIEARNPTTKSYKSRVQQKWPENLIDAKSMKKAT